MGRGLVFATFWVEVCDAYGLSTEEVVSIFDLLRESEAPFSAVGCKGGRVSLSLCLERVMKGYEPLNLSEAQGLIDESW